MSQEERPVVAASGTKGPLGLLVIGAGLIVANWVILGLMVGRWNPSTFYIVLALMVLLSAFTLGGFSIGVKVQKFIGWFFGLSAMVILLESLRYNSFPDDATGWIATLLFYIASALMFFGARGISD